MRVLTTPKGTIQFPAVIPVTTLGQRYQQTDNLVRPFLKRLASAAMSNYFYASKMQPEQHPGCPLWIDSGGFALLKNPKATIEVQKTTTRGETWNLGKIVLPPEQENEPERVISAPDVLSIQTKFGEVALTLDLPCPSSLSEETALQRIELSKNNALWTRSHCQSIPLYGVIPVWDVPSSIMLAKCYSEARFDGIAIGGLIPRLRNTELVEALVKGIRQATDLPLHALGIGTPTLIEFMFSLGIDSSDSSSYAKQAANGKLWGRADFHLEQPSPLERRDLALLNLAAATQTQSQKAAPTQFQTWNLNLE